MIIAGHHVDDAMFDYIATNRDADTYKLLLKDEPELTFDKSFAILQIECRRRAKNKIPELLLNERFLFPKAISAEQCTHQLVAQYHASQFSLSDNVLDMTMGLGVDDYYISKCVNSVIAIELDKDISEVGKHNFSFLASNVNVLTGDSVQYLKSLKSEQRFDTIFIDPARRGDDGKRKFGFADCQPDVLSLLDLIKQHGSKLYIKASPMLDITKSIHDFGNHLTDVFAVSVKNECKELLFKLDFSVSSTAIMLHALNHDGTEWQRFECHYSECLGDSASPPRIDLKSAYYLYEPNSSIMRLGCFNAVEQTFDATQLAHNSHIMVSSRPIADFPGRQFKILEVVPFKGKEIKSLSKRYKKLNVATRNFRLSAESLKQRLRVEDGGNIYLFATTLSNNEQVLILCEKVT